MKLKRILSGALCAVMLLGLMPALSSDAAAEEVERMEADSERAGVAINGYLNSGDPDGSTYYADSFKSLGVSSAAFVNSALTAKDGGAPRIQQEAKSQFAIFNLNQRSVDKADGVFLDSDGTQMKDENNQPISVSAYNMFNLFGKHGEAKAESAAGFYAYEYYVNSGGCSEGLLTIGAHDSELSNGLGARIRIADNPTLKALAETGDLSFYFSGMAVGATAGGCSDDESEVYVDVYLDGSLICSSGWTTSWKYMTTGSYLPLQANSVIDFYFGSDAPGCNNDEWANANIGLANGILLFRKTSCPNLETYELTSNGDLHSLANGITEIHLTDDGMMNLTLGFSEPVVTALKNVRPGMPGYQQLMLLSKHCLFSNTEGTGYINQGKPVYLYLDSVLDRTGIRSVTDTDQRRANALQNPLKELSYTWNAGAGDFYGDNALPNDGDWAGDVSASNEYNLIDKLVLASLHDLAGNPLLINGQPLVYGKKEISQDVLPGTVKLVNDSGAVKYTKENVGNPFAATNKANSGFDFIIDAVTPTFSLTSNAVQPEILTDLVLNEGDSFDVLLQYSKTVKLRPYFTDGTETGYAENTLEVVFTNGMTGTYKKGLGTKTLTFTVNVPGKDADVETENLELAAIRVADPKNAGSYVTNEVLTDYVGNPLMEKVGDVTIGTSMSWAGLKVDNTPPVITIETQRVGDVDYYRVNITDNRDVEGGASGVYHVYNATSGPDNQKGLFYYLWVKGEEAKDQAIADLTADNYALVKRYSLGVSISDSGYELKAANNGELIEVTEEVRNGGDWYLLVFTADMTWDSARQLIQYKKASYRTQPKTYYENLLEALGLKLDGGFFELAASEPQNWAEVYTNYYRLVESTYIKLKEGNDYPDFTKDTYYRYEFQLLEEEPDDWDKEYTSCFISDGKGGYRSIPASTGVPTWKSDTFYTQYEAVTGETAPADWDTNSGSYYIRVLTTKRTSESEVTYVPEYITVIESMAPAFTPNTYYKYENGGYTLLESAPEDWTSTFYNYYTKQAVSYSNVPPVEETPAFKLNTFYEKVESYEPLGMLPPEDWESNAEAYFVKVDETQYAPVTGTPVYDMGLYYEYVSEYRLLLAAPGDWESNFTGYYKKRPEQLGADEDGYLAVTKAPEFKADKYYVQNFTLQTTAEAPTGWTDYYSEYYTKSGDTYEKVPAAPEYVPGMYYMCDNMTYTLLEGEKAPEDWVKNCRGYYVKNGDDTYTAIDPAPYEANKYYLPSADILAKEPNDWEIGFEGYFVKDPDKYDRIADKVTGPLAKYEKGKFFRKLGSLTLMSDPPEDWSSAYRYYFLKDGSGVQEELYPPFEKDTYYAFAPKKLTEQPADWMTNYSSYVYFDQSFQDYAAAVVTEDNRLKNVPEFKANTYYTAAAGIATLASKLTTAERQNAFMERLLACSNSTDQIDVIRGYYEFASQVHAADTKTMALAANYSEWSNSTFEDEDSNWTSAFVKSVYDVTAPAAEATGTEGDNSEDPIVTVKVTDDNSISAVEYQFVPAGTVVNDETESGWVTAELSGAAAAEENVELSAAVYSASFALADGSYDLYVRTTDSLGNTGCSEKLATVVLNTKVETACEISEPEGTSPYAKLAGLTAALSGTVNGKDLTDSGLKVYAAWDENATKTDDSGWSELTGTSGIFTVPTLEKVQGFYFLHIRYTYERSGETVTEYVNQSYMVDGLTGEPTFNLLGVTDESITVEITAVNADSIWYQVSEDIETELTAASAGWTELSSLNPEVVIKKADHPDAANIRLWAKSGDTVASEIYSLNAADSGSDALPVPTMGLADLIRDPESGIYKAIIRLSMDESLLAASAEYSYAVSDNRTNIADVEWKRWMPYESTVAVDMGSSPAGKRLIFKFRNGENVTAEEDYQILADFSNPDGKAWAVVSRSTLQNVGPKDGVSLQFLCKDGYSIAEAVKDLKVEKANGVYTYTLTDGNELTDDDGNLFVSINNIDITPPGYSLEWNDGGNHQVTKSGVVVTLKPTEDVRITDVTFTSADGKTQTRAPLMSTYSFKENGSVKFTFSDAAGNQNTATARVTWIDLSKPEFTIVPDYSAYRTAARGSDLVASGVRLILQPTKTDSFVATGTEGSDVFYLDVTENGTYKFTMGDSLDNYVTNSYTVDNLITGQAAPEQTDSTVSGGRVFVTVSGTIAGYASGNRLYDGRSTDGVEVNAANSSANVTYTCDAQGNYTITRSYSCNGEATAYICDSLGYATPYKMQIGGLDSVAPTVKLPAGAISLTKGTAMTQSWWKNQSGVQFSDNVNTAEELTVSTDTTIDSNVVGAYSVILTVTDTSGNKASVRTTVYVIPSGGLIVTTDKGILFSAASKDAALVDDHTILLKISNFDLMQFAGETVRNKAATCSVTVKQGIFREGQMKYFDTRINNLSFVEGQNYSMVTLDTNLLPGTGWYTIIVRTSEREREYTTFFINP